MNRLTDHEHTLAVISGLANLQAFLKDHPDLPLGLGDMPFRVHVTGRTDEEKRAEVDRIGVILGTPARYEYGGATHYAAIRDFGGGVTYEAIAISRAYMDRYTAAHSYLGVVQPEMAAAA